MYTGAIPETLHKNSPTPYQMCERNAYTHFLNRLDRGKCALMNFIPNMLHSHSGNLIILKCLVYSSAKQLNA